MTIGETLVAQRANAPNELPDLPTDAGLVWRPLTPDDVPTWFALTQTIENYDDAIERGSEQDLVDLFKASWRDPERDSIGGFDESGQLRAYAWSLYRAVTSGTLAPILIGGVHPERRNRGVGRALLAWLEARARQQLAATDSTLPARLRFYVDDHHAKAKSLAEHAGFIPLRWYVDMRRDLSLPLPEIQMPSGIGIEPYTADHDQEVRTTHNESFAVDHWGSSPVDADVWALEVIGDDGFRPDWSFVAVEIASGRVVGYIMNCAYPREWEAHGFTQGWTQIIGVRREYRGRGMAASLLVQAMRAFQADKMEYAGLDVDTDNPTGALGLYTKLGYVQDHKSVLYTKELDS